MLAKTAGAKAILVPLARCIAIGKTHLEIVLRELEGNTNLENHNEKNASCSTRFLFFMKYTIHGLCITFLDFVLLKILLAAISFFFLCFFLLLGLKRAQNRVSTNRVIPTNIDIFKFNGCFTPKER